VIRNDGVIDWNDTTGANLIRISDVGTNFGAALDAGAFVQYNSYFGEEFSRERGNINASTAQSWGDFQAWTVTEQADSTNDCTFSILDDSINSLGRMVNSQVNTTCSAYLGGDTLGDLHKIVDVDNLPVALIKLRASDRSATVDSWAGFGDDISLGDVDPTNGVFFTNDNGTNWNGRTTSGGTPTTVPCNIVIETTRYALLKIEVRSSTEVRFYVDNDVSDGVSFVYCGASTSNIPTVAMAPFVKSSSAVTSRTFEYDFFRVWQDDASTKPKVIESNLLSPIQAQEKPSAIVNSNGQLPSKPVGQNSNPLEVGAISLIIAVNFAVLLVIAQKLLAPRGLQLRRSNYNRAL
jgi:hypothetical protein